MNEIWWIKLATEMFDDEKIKIIESMPDADTLLIIWVKLLCQAGKVNANGYIFLSRDIPFSDDNLSTLFNRPVNTIRLALTTFQHFGMIQIDEKGIIFITNWDRYQSIDGMDKIREQGRLRVQKYRQIQHLTEPLNGNVTRNVTVTHSSLSPSMSNSPSKSSKDKEIVKREYGEFKNVLLSDEEHKKLMDLYNGSTPDKIERLSAYKSSTGKRYKSDYATILNWARRDNDGTHQQNNTKPAPGHIITDPSKFTRPEDY